MKRAALFFLAIFSFTLFSMRIVSAQKDSVTVGFIMASTFNDRWLKDRDYFVEEIKELGGKVIVVDCFDQVDNQIKAAKEFVEKKVDGIVIVAIDAVASGAAVTIAKDAGIPVVAYDRMILKAPVDYYVSFNSITVGEEMAIKVTSKLDKGNILYLGGPSEDYNSKFIRQGVFNVLDTLQDKYNVNSIQASTWNQLDAYLVFQDYLSNDNPMPDAVICGADALVRGVVDVLFENDKVGSVVITGQDAELDICKMITRNEVEMTIYKPIEKLAEVAADVIWNAISGKKVEASTTFNNELIEVPAILLTPIVVTKDNLKTTIIKDGYYTEEQIYGK